MSDFEKVEKSDLQKVINNLNSEEKFLYDIEDMKFKLIQNLVKYRQFKGITQKDVSIITGMSQQAVSRIEKYGNEPTLSSLLKYIKALDLNINDIFKNMAYNSINHIKDLNDFEKELQGKSFDELVDILASQRKIDETKFMQLSKEEMEKEAKIIKNKIQIIKSKMKIIKEDDL